MAVLPLGGDAAPDVALGLVELQDLPGLEVESPVIERQPLGDILVDRGLADAELRGGGTDRRLVLDDVLGQRGGPLLDIALPIRNTPRLSLLQPMRPPGGVCRRDHGTFRGNDCPRHRDHPSAKGGQTLDKNDPLPTNPAKARKRQRKQIDKIKKESMFVLCKRKNTRDRA